MKTMTLTAIFFFFFFSPGWGESLERLTQEERRDLADAYDQVGGRYKELGKEAKGERFKQFAATLDPNVLSEQEELEEEKVVDSPSALPRKEESVPPSLALEDEERQEETTMRENPRASLRYYFAKYLIALFSANVEALLSTMTDPIQISLMGGGRVSVPLSKVREQLKMFFAAHEEFRKLSPEALYDIDSLRFAEASDDGTWTLSILFTYRDPPYTEDWIIPLHTGTHYFDYRWQDSGEWKLIGLAYDPSHYRPGDPWPCAH